VRCSVSITARKGKRKKIQRCVESDLGFWEQGRTKIGTESTKNISESAEG
jgi:hypothetical protein